MRYHFPNKVKMFQGQPDRALAERCSRHNQLIEYMTHEESLEAVTIYYLRKEI